MSAMTDPTPAMESMQEVLRAGRMRLEPGLIDPALGTFGDQANGKPRYAFVHRDGDTITAFAVMIAEYQIGGLPVFHAGIAVPPAYRGQGRAKGILSAAISEASARLAGLPPFYVEAVVGIENAASNAVCRALLTSTPDRIKDSVSGKPALHYLRQFATVRP